MWNDRDRPQVSGDILAGEAVAPRRALGEPAALVTQGHRQTVDLQLGHIAQLRGVGRSRRKAENAADPRIKRAQLVVAEGVAQREHRPAVADLVERARRCAADALRGRIRRDQGWKRRLERDELRKQPVVLGVAQLRGVLSVVELVCPLDLPAQLGVAGFGYLRLQRRCLADERGVDGQALRFDRHA